MPGTELGAERNPHADNEAVSDAGSQSRGGRSIPRGRLSRLGVFGRLAGGVAGGVVAEGARRL
ncbi:hypothetical protein, partial [Sphingomonas sp. FUKUSWIS1]